MTRRVTISRERTASCEPSILPTENSSSAVRQCRLRHCDETRVRVAPPNGIRLARPLSSRFRRAAG